jgi:BirA family biotin operon repressor/biotin-[acetyl-CoA-carboxylase] ligase
LPPSIAKTAIGQPFIELSEIKSTNMHAMGQVLAGMAGHGAAFFAHSQTAGKGQRGKTWQSEPGSNLALSVVADSSFLSVHEAFSLSVCVALAIHDVIQIYTGDETRLKWPNDLYWRDRKAGGVLIENHIRGQLWPWSVVGIGINVNQTRFPEGTGHPVSLKQITGKDHSPLQLAKEICAALDIRYHQLLGGDFKKLLQQYNELLFARGRQVRLKKDNIAFVCTIDGVSALGELLVSGAMQESFRFGEVQWEIDRPDKKP